MVSGDSVNAGASYAFDTKNAGTGKTVSLSGAALSGTDAGNYSLGTIAATTAAITPKALSLTYTADASSSRYGDTLTGLSGSYAVDGLVNGDMLSGTAIWSTMAGSSSNVGSYAVTGSGLSAGSNYMLTTSQASGNATALTIIPRALTITADDLSRIYGDANPVLTYTVGGQGLVNGDTLSGVLATLAGTGSNVGGYAITQGSLSAGSNYALSFTGGTLTITPRALSILYTANGASSRYGDMPTGLSGSYAADGLVNGDMLSGSATWSTTANGGSSVGSYAISGSGLSASNNYTLTTSQASDNATALTITPRALTITADDLSRIYGEANPVLTYIVGGQGLVNGDTLSGVLATPAGTGSSVGSYAITQGSLSAGSNYALSFTGGTLTITPRALNILYTADASSSRYGDTPTGLSGSYAVDGLVNGDMLSGTAIWSTAASSSSDVGSYSITGSGLSAGSNYTLTTSQASGNATALTITPRALTITADDFSRIYGDANPVLSYTVGGQGLVNGDTLSGVLATLAGTESNVGGYAITQGSLSAGSNYALSFTGGMLRITPRALTGTASARDKIYDGTRTADGQILLTGVLFGDDVGAGGSFTFADRNVGNGKAVSLSGIGLFGADAGNYSLGMIGPVTASITPRPITIAADDQRRFFNEDNPPLTYRVGGLGLVGDDGLSGVLATDAMRESAPGAYAIGQGSLTAGGNYQIRFEPGSLTVLPGIGPMPADAFIPMVTPSRLTDVRIAWAPGEQAKEGSDTAFGADGFFSEEVAKPACQDAWQCMAQGGR